MQTPDLRYMSTPLIYDLMFVLLPQSSAAIQCLIYIMMIIWGRSTLLERIIVFSSKGQNAIVIL